VLQKQIVRIQFASQPNQWAMYFVAHGPVDFTGELPWLQKDSMQLSHAAAVQTSVAVKSVRAADYPKALRMLTGSGNKSAGNEQKPLELNQEKLAATRLYADWTIDHVIFNIKKYIEATKKATIDIDSTLANMKTGKNYRSYNRQFDLLLEKVRIALVCLFCVCDASAPSHLVNLTVIILIQIRDLVQKNTKIRDHFASMNEYSGMLIELLVAALRFIEGSRAAHNFPASVLLDIIAEAPCLAVRSFLSPRGVV
jgi:hypothetical protein